MTLAVVFETVTLFAVAPLGVDFLPVFVELLDNRSESRRVLLLNIINLLLPERIALIVVTADAVAVLAELSLSETLAIKLETAGIAAVASGKEVLFGREPAFGSLEWKVVFVVELEEMVGREERGLFERNDFQTVDFGGGKLVVHFFNSFLKKIGKNRHLGVQLVGPESLEVLEVLGGVGLRMDPLGVGGEHGGEVGHFPDCGNGREGELGGFVFFFAGSVDREFFSN